MTIIIPYAPFTFSTYKITIIFMFFVPKIEVVWLKKHPL